MLILGYIATVTSVDRTAMSSVANSIIDMPHPLFMEGFPYCAVADKKFIDVIKLISLVTDLADKSCMRGCSLRIRPTVHCSCICLHYTVVA